MDGIIKVTPERLIEVANDFGTQGAQIQSLTSEMMDLVMATSSAWEGEAQAAYVAKFRGLQDDMDKIFRMIQEHSNDLQEMASNYMQAESKNEETAQSLSDSVIV